jgi:hypothetical protein
MGMMKRLWLGVVSAVIVAAVTGCSAIGGDNSTKGAGKAEAGAQAEKYAATIRVLPYADQRNMTNPRKIGVGAENLSGLSGLKGTDILLEGQDVASLVTDAMKKRLDRADYQTVEPGQGDAMFELSGVVKELTYDVKARDEVSIAIESTLKEAATGKVLWSGLVTEKANRFAGVGGNSMKDVVQYLKRELGIVTQKTSDAVTALLVAQHPELFNVAAGTKPIPGVKVLNTPVAAPVAPVAAPASAVAPTYVPHASATKGLLIVTTEPARAKIYVGGVYYGLSPLRLEMAPGIREVTAKLDGYKKASEKVSIRKGDNTEVELKLER